MKYPDVIAVSGEKNSGKTTLIEAVLPILAARGYRVAVIKHDGHSFEPDVPGTATRRSPARRIITTTGCLTDGTNSKRSERRKI